MIQLYPFACKYLLGVDPKSLNGDCFNLLDVENFNVGHYHQKLKSVNSLEKRIEGIFDLIEALVSHSRPPKNDQIQNSIELILRHDGNIKIQEVLQDVHMSERNFERQFKAEVGLTPKQFAQIIRFQKSLNQIRDERFEKLTHIGFDNGFVDQSHFIRTFKNYTGQTPTTYIEQQQIQF